MDWLPDLSNPDVWSVLAIKTLRQPQPRVAIAPQEVPLSSAIAQVEAKCFTAPPSWYQAGWATAFLSADGANRVQISRQALSLENAALIVLPKTSGFYTLQISFPRWIPQIRLIVKEFIGEDIRTIDKLNHIEARLDVIN